MTDRKEQKRAERVFDGLNLEMEAKRIVEVEPNLTHHHHQPENFRIVTKKQDSTQTHLTTSILGGQKQLKMASF